jgi:Transcriptional regulator
MTHSIAGLQGRSDQIKSKVYGKMGKEIVQACRAGGPDPTSNMRLRDLIATAKEQNVPRDIVDRNIKRASEVKTDFSEVWPALYVVCMPANLKSTSIPQSMYWHVMIQVLYEARGPGGAGFIAAALTDNLNRLVTGPQAAWISDHMSPCTCRSCSCSICQECHWKRDANMGTQDSGRGAHSCAEGRGQDGRCWQRHVSYKFINPIFFDKRLQVYSSISI